MKNLRKTESFNLRLSPVQWSKLGKAARIESRRRAESIERSTLARELMMAGVDAILARETVEAA